MHEPHNELNILSELFPSLWIDTATELKPRASYKVLKSGNENVLSFSWTHDCLGQSTEVFWISQLIWSQLHIPTISLPEKNSCKKPIHIKYFLTSLLLLCHLDQILPVCLTLIDKLRHITQLSCYLPRSPKVSFFSFLNFK